MNKYALAVLPVLLLSASAIMAPAMAQTMACSSFGGQMLAGGKIDSAYAVPEGDFTAPGARATILKNLPAFCRVTATLTPSSDSDIKIEIWLPAKWNGKLEAVGNGGWAGTISYDAMAASLAAGYATVSTDTGHVGSNGRFVTGHPEKFTDFAWRSEHLMTVAAKAAISAFYGKAQAEAYWNGCSTGDRQGLMEATRFPDDFDSIIAGDPVTPRTVHDAWALSAAAQVAKNPASVIPESKYAMIHQAALDQCDARDGLIENPAQCHFDPAVLLCKAGDAPTCLTADQVKTAKMLLSPGRSGGADYYPGLLPGSEMGWKAYALGEEPLGADNFRYVVYHDANWDWHNFDADAALAPARAADLQQSVATADLSPFTAHHGKLILYHGLADPLVSPLGSLDLYGDMRKQTHDFANSVRLFLVPGMGHCGGGEGATDNFDMVSALDHWVTSGAAPKSVTAANLRNNHITRTRPLCAWPLQAAYGGTGSSEDAANFVCKAAK